MCVSVFVGGASSSVASTHVVISLFFISFLTSFERYEMSTMLMAAEMLNTVGAGDSFHFCNFQENYFTPPTLLLFIFHLLHM